MLEPDSRQIGEIKWDALDDEQVVACPAVVASETVVLEPDARVGFSIVLHDRGQSAIASRRDSGEHIRTEGPQTSGSGVRLRLRSSLLS